jgi:hypothetical protein
LYVSHHWHALTIDWGMVKETEAGVWPVERQYLLEAFGVGICCVSLLPPLLELQTSGEISIDALEKQAVLVG